VSRTASDVIVVGGGPAGAATAWFLARSGLDVVVLDRARFPRDKPCAEYLSPQASRILEAMGALSIVESSGPAQLGGMVVRAPNGERIQGDFAATHGFSGFRDRGLAIRRRILDTILLDRARAAGARIIEETRVADLVREADGRVTGVRTLERGAPGNALAARIVIGADGLRSVVARKLGVARRLPWPRRIAFVTHYRGVTGLGERGEMHVEKEGYLGIADVGGGLANVALVVPMARVRASLTDPAAHLDQWLRDHRQLASRFAGAERVSKVAATGPFASAVRRAWAPGAALVGDAADFFDPFTGEGIYAALRGGELLAPFVVAALAASSPAEADAALTAYDRARRAEFRGKWRVERMIGAAVAWPPLINHAARVLARRKDMADLLVGVAGDFVPPAEVLRPGYLLRLLFPPLSRA
jgi:geranylgeranyl reductase family protein